MAKNHLPGLVSDHGPTSADSDVLKAVSTIRKNYKTKLEQVIPIMTETIRCFI